MNLRQIYEYYSREDIRDFITNFSKDREVAGVFSSGSFSERPNIIQYPNDILAMVKKNIIEFHSSLERWSQPMNLKSDNYDQLRKGWDLILDIDCKLFEHGKIASDAFIWGLKKHDIKGVSIKFTGGTGFHIGIPWESFPKEINYKPTAGQYPDLARIIGRYLKYTVREKLEKTLLKNFSAEELSQQVNKKLGKIFTEDGIDPFQIVDVDPILISPRHLFRTPYSLNKKTFLVSLPIKPKDIEDFETFKAEPEKVKVDEGFLDFYEKEESSILVMEASDWWAHISYEEKYKMLKEEQDKLRRMGYNIKIDEIEKFRKFSPHVDFKEIKEIVPKKFFPPCIKNISKGLPDGRKRSLFVTINFLRLSNWSWDNIEKYIFDWNQKNNPPLRENLIRSHIRWSKNRKEAIPPPNCFKEDSKEEGYYKNFEVCEPDGRCEAIKNPVSYPRSMIKKQKSKKTKKKQKPKKVKR